MVGETPVGLGVSVAVGVTVSVGGGEAIGEEVAIGETTGLGKGGGLGFKTITGDDFKIIVGLGDGKDGGLGDVDRVAVGDGLGERVTEEQSVT